MQHILFTDVDRTLLTHTYEVLREVEQAFELAREAGLKIVFVTARAPESLVPIAKTLRNTGICCCFGGGWIGELTSDAALETHRLESPLASHIVSRAMSLGSLPIWYDIQKVYAPIINDVVARQLGNVGEVALPVDDWTSVPPPMKIMIIDKREQATLGELAKEIVESATVSFSHRHLLEIGPRHVNKGTGLKSVLTQIPAANAVVHAAGDAENDLPLLAAAQHRYTVANGLEELKRMSEFIGRSCDEGGLADIISHIVNCHL